MAGFNSFFGGFLGAIVGVLLLGYLAFKSGWGGDDD